MDSATLSYSQLRATLQSSIGVVVIGRNEGERLKRCLQSVVGRTEFIVYVDSGSTDESAKIAVDLGVKLLQLDTRTPFTAARARNEGFKQLLAAAPDLELVCFVDGDCEVVNGWFENAQRFLNHRPDVGLVWGTRRERYPDKSLYNMLCDIEWSSYPAGESKGCGGDAIIRTQAFQEVEGYRAQLICGEEPELCVRLRQVGWRIWHLDDAMTVHDAAMYHFRQWWTRMVRTGYAFAEGAALHGAPPERHWVRESRSIWLWAALLPLTTICLTLFLGGWALLFTLAYPLQVVRLALRGKRTPRENWWGAGALVLCKFPAFWGQLKFLVDRQRHVTAHLIEYK